MIGVIAIIVALVANNRARTAERRATDRAIDERRIIFEFEILRDLLAVLDDQGPLYHFVLNPETAAPQLGARLSMLPRSNCPLGITSTGTNRQTPEQLDVGLSRIVGWNCF